MSTLEYIWKKLRESILMPFTT